MIFVLSHLKISLRSVTLMTSISEIDTVGVGRYCPRVLSTAARNPITIPHKMCYYSVISRVIVGCDPIFHRLPFLWPLLSPHLPFRKWLRLKIEIVWNDGLLINIHHRRIHTDVYKLDGNFRNCCFSSWENFAKHFFVCKKKVVQSSKIVSKRFYFCFTFVNKQPTRKIFYVWKYQKPSWKLN